MTPDEFGRRRGCLTAFIVLVVLAAALALCVSLAEESVADGSAHRLWLPEVSSIGTFRIPEPPTFLPPPPPTTTPASTWTPAIPHIHGDRRP